ncbi:MAG: hypothetical protein JWM87_1412 [Candidatus Eremiobacteraeota bacterium]|nr:hypothetical protein [Candidatus Eremiobacteraeota bacterium]
MALSARRTTLSYFTGSFVVTAIMLLAGFAYGYVTGGLKAGFAALALVAILSVLEVSLSFDNAVVNATILQHWDAKWRRVFLVFGILVAVVGMRLLFPILIVALASAQSLGAVVDLAFRHPAEYAAQLTSSKYLVEAFGGAFLLMIALGFFLDREKDDHWIGPVEARLTALGQIEAIQGLITLGTVLVVAHFVAPEPQRAGFELAGVLGVMAFIASKGLGTLLGGEEAEAGQKIVRASVAGFLYLELLDASFSFDGVIGAFAITTSLPLIMFGLGTGAYFVRSLTIWLVDNEKLAEYRYLSHGAYWAIAVLAGIMLASVRYEIPDIVTGFIGALLIGAAFHSATAANRRDAAA